MFFKAQNKLKKKNGQAVLEFALAFPVAILVMFYMFDFATLVQAKMVTTQYARNAARIVIMTGLKSSGQSENSKSAQDAKGHIYNLCYHEHPGDVNNARPGQITACHVEVYDSPRSGEIKNDAVGQYPVTAKVCVTPMLWMNKFQGKSSNEVCSSYLSYHSTQYQKGKG